MPAIEIIAHQGLWASTSADLTDPARLDQRQKRSALQGAIAEGFGQEVDVMGGLMNGASTIALSSPYPFGNHFEFELGTMRFAELLELRNDARDSEFNPGTLLIDVKQPRDRMWISDLLAANSETDFRIFNIDGQSDWDHFRHQTEYVAEKLLRTYSDRSPMLLGTESTPVFQEARGVYIDQMRDLSGEMHGGHDNFSTALEGHLEMAHTALKHGKEVVLTSGDVMKWGTNPHDSDEAAQPYRRQWKEWSGALRDLVREHPQANIKILTNFPEAARQQFAPIAG